MTLTENMIFPRWLGEPVYMGGMPVKPENHCIEGRSIRELFHQYCECQVREQPNNLTDFQMKAMKDYIIYYYHAPLWKNEELLKEDMEKMSVEELLDLGMEWGLDPF